MPVCIIACMELFPVLLLDLLIESTLLLADTSSTHSLMVVGSGCIRVLFLLCYLSSLTGCLH